MTQKIVAVTRVLNEDDIVEAFLRHHATMVDHHILLDNGSIDHTLAIIRRLHEEGLPLTLCANRSVVFQEIYFNSTLYHMARRFLNADWVVYLDCDEFLDLRPGGTDLRRLLAAVPDAIPAIRVDMINYRQTAADDPAELIVPLRIGHRMPDLSNVWKIFLRGSLPGDVLVDAGNHGATHNGETVQCADTDSARLAHFSIRSPWQELTKFAVGRLKVLATDTEAPFNSHYNEPFEMLLHRPGEMLSEARLTPPDAAGLVHDPIHYAGGALRFTNGTDYRMKAVQSLLSYTERLARHHAELLAQTRDGGLAAAELKIERIL